MRNRAGNDCGDMDLIASCSKDSSQLAFLAPLSDKYNCLAPQDFVPWARKFLQLPPLTRLGNATPVDGYDYAMETCLGTHSQGIDKLDLYGSHDNGMCGPTAQGKHSGHTWMEWVINRFARKVPGVRCVLEPKTHLVLHDQFTEQQCRSLFPKSPSQQRVEDIQNVVDEINEVRKLPPGEDRTRRQRDLSARINALNTTSDSEEKKTVRLDLQLQRGRRVADRLHYHALTGPHHR